MWFSYSAFSQYQKCPKQYYLQRVKKVQPPVPESKHNAWVGTVVQNVFEEFYEKELWRKKGEVLDILLDRTKFYNEQFLLKNHVDFSHRTCKYKSKDDPLQDCLDLVPKVLSAIKREKLLGPYAKSEVKIEARLRNNDLLFGYLDFVIRKPDGTVLLLDGKSTKYREKGVDLNQLYFYALLFYFRYKKLPDKLGFLYFRFADDPELAFDWYDPLKTEIKKLRENIVEALDNIYARNFQATPVPSNCQWCPYEDMCPERKQQKAVNSGKRAASSNKEKVEVKKDDKGFVGF